MNAINNVKPRYFLKLIVIVMLLLNIIPSAALSSTTDNPQFVTTTVSNGTLKGEKLNNAISFKGIPYGDNTAGQNRFKAPQPAKNWIGIRDATQYGDLAPQHISSMGMGSDTMFAWYAQTEPVTMSENSLMLNVFTPDLNNQANRPVLFYVHGGGYISGGGSGAALDGSNLAHYGDVVVVTINHRLNIFGYMNLQQTGDANYADAANAGNLDIVAALRWVKNNITHFGGNPDNVTLFGQSGGGSKIMTLLAMPEAQGLFHKAVSMSGAAGINIDQAENIEPYANAILSELNISKDNLAALAVFSTDELIAARDRAIKSSGQDGSRPVIDGKHITTHPMSLEGLAMQKNIPLLLGYTRTEASLFFRADPRNFSMSEQQMRKRMKKSFTIDDDKITRIMHAYRQDQPNMTPYDIFVAVASDVQFRLPLEKAAAIKSSAPNQAPVYLYQFAWGIPALNGVLGSPHAVDIPFVFGTLDSAKEMIGNDSAGAQITSLDMMNAFINFAKTGNPNNERLPNWPAYNAHNQSVMVLNANSHVENKWREAVNSEINDLSIDPFNRADLYRFSE